MANLYGTSTTYVSFQDVKDTTRIAALKAETQGVIDPFILEAQSMVDTYVMSAGQKYSQDQSTLFPIIDSDGESLIPNDVKLATVNIVEALYLGGSPSLQSLTGSAVKSERVGDHAVEYSSTTNAASFGLPESAWRLLTKYRLNFIKPVV